MTCLEVNHSTEICQRLADADERCVRADRALIGAILRRLGGTAGLGDADWPETAEADRADDERFELEERAIQSGDAEAIGMVRRRRQRDDV